MSEFQGHILPRNISETSSGGGGITFDGTIAIGDTAKRSGASTLGKATIGTGDVVGPASSTDTAIARFDGVTGKLIENSTVLIADDGTTTFTDATFNSSFGGLGIPSDVYFYISEDNAGTGGVQLLGITTTAGSALQFIGLSDQVELTGGVVKFAVGKSDGAGGVTSLGSTDLAVIFKQVTGVDLLGIYGNGDINTFGTQLFTDTDQANFTFNIPISNTDAISHSWTFDIGSFGGLMVISATGDGAGGLVFKQIDIEAAIGILGDVDISGDLTATNFITEGRIEFHSPIAVTAGVREIFQNLADNLQFNTPLGRTFVFSENAVTKATLDTNGFELIDGSASLPSYAFISETTSGIYRPGAGQIGVTTAGVQSVIFSVTGTQSNWLFNTQLSLKDHSSNEIFNAITNGAFTWNKFSNYLLVQSVQTSGTPTAFQINGGAHTTLTNASFHDINLGFNRTVQFIGGAGATNFNDASTIELRPANYQTAGAGVLTILNGTTLYISGAPGTVAGGGGVVITNQRALWINSGTSEFDGMIVIGGSAVAAGASNTYFIQKNNASGNPLLTNVPFGSEFQYTVSGAEIMSMNGTGMKLYQPLTWNNAVLPGIDGTQYQIGKTNNPELAFNVPTGSQFDFLVGGGGNSVVLISDITAMTIRPLVHTSGNQPRGFIYNQDGITHTGIDGSSADTDVIFNITNVQFDATNVGLGPFGMQVNAPTYSATAANSTLISATFTIDQAPQAGTNFTMTNQTAFQMGGQAQANATNSSLFLGIIPNISNGFGNMTTLTVFALPDLSGIIGPIMLGDQTATLTNLNMIRIEAQHFDSDTLTRTVTNPAALVLNCAIADSGRVVFTNPALSLWCQTGAARFDSDIIGATRLAVGSSATIGLSGGYDKLFDLSATITNFSSSTSWEGLRSYITLAPTGNIATTSMYAHDFNVKIPNTNTFNIGHIECITGYLDLGGSGNITNNATANAGIVDWSSTGTVTNNLIGTSGIAINRGAGSTVDALNAGYFKIETTTGTTTNGYGIQIDFPTTGGTMTNLWGLKIEDQIFGGAAVRAIQTGVGAVQFGDSTSIGGALSGSVAILELISTTKGLLLPRMTTTQRNAITPVEGLVVYDLTLHGTFQYDGTTWVQL